MKSRQRTAGVVRMMQTVAGLLFGLTGIALTLAWAKSAPELESNSKTIEEARQDILRRPTWPYAWMQMASLLAQQGRYGAELDVALRRTEELAPLEGAINFHRAVLALEHMRAPLPPYSRELLLTSLRDEREEHPGLMQAYVFLSRRHREYCALPDQSEQETRWCKSLPWQQQRCRDRYFDAAAEKDCTKLMAYYTKVLGNWKNTVDVRRDRPS